jgi:hypothetical protein
MIGRDFWPIVLLSALVVCLGLGVVVAHSKSTQGECLLIETISKTELFDLQTFSTRIINPPAMSADQATFQVFS